MVDIRHGWAAFAAITCVIVLTNDLAWAQPPVARPLPPPKPPGTEAAKVPAPSPQPPQTAPAPSAATPAPALTRPITPSGEQPPTEAYLGAPIMPNAQYFGSYDAGGSGQRFYLFGSQHPFLDVVAYYRTVLRDKGELVFDSPATHMFEVGKFREDQVAFPPSVTVKDYALNGLPGLANPRPGAGPATFPTVIQIVPPAVVPPSRPR